MKPINGFTDVFGVDLRRRRYLGQIFGSVAESFGFEPLEVPVVEQAAAYSEEIVGLSPWPEWNPKGIFDLSISNYHLAYNQEKDRTAAVLIPEGTLSVTRWLGDRLSQLKNPWDSPDLPLKLYYEVGCYRNELLSTLSNTKGRQFTQFGIEILGSSSIAADLEVMSISAEALRALGISDSSINFRVSSNLLYSALGKQSGLEHSESIMLKEMLDTLGECKAGKKPERFAPVRTAVIDALEHKSVPDKMREVWMYVIDRAPGPVTNEDHRMLAPIHESELHYLETICSTMGEGALTIDVDFCVVRSHEYYTGLTFEIDLVGNGKRHVEVGGGGRYDRLLGNFIESSPGLVIPSMGYAFGLERLQAALVDVGYLQGVVDPIPYAPNLSSDKITCETLGIGESDVETAKKYLATVAALRPRRLREPVSVTFD